MPRTFLDPFLAPHSERAYAALRVVSGALLSFHGMQKVLGVLGDSKPVMSQLWVGGVIELVAGLLIAIGFLTRPAAFLASGTMAVAYFQYHWKFQMGAQFFPAINQGELAVVYCFLFLYIACRGAGSFGMDKRS